MQRNTVCLAMPREIRDRRRTMDPYENKKPIRYQRSRPAFFLLVLLGCGIIFFSLALIACAFTINYADDFEVKDGAELEAFVQSRFSYCQYWAGIPFLVTGLLVLFAGIWQRSRGLTITTVILCYISVALTLLVLAADSGNFYTWRSAHRLKLYWDAKSGYSCSSSTGTCVCSPTVPVTGTNPELIFKGGFFVECDEISELSALYGVVIGSVVMVTLFCLFSVIIITKSMTWKRLRYVQQSYYPEDYYMQSRRPPSVVEVPTNYGNRDEYADKYGALSGPPYKQTIYRNYPY